MCGRYILAQADQFERAVGKIHWSFEVSYNVAPTQPVPVVRTAHAVREGVMLRWGLIPYFARAVAPKYSTINATIERLESGPAWRGPWKRGQRCVQLCAGFYEWHLTKSGRKQPFFIHLADHEVFGFASIWDRSIGERGAAVESCALVTMPANALMREIHNTGANPYRMPAILAPSDFGTWLDGSQEEAHSLLKPYPVDLMVAHAVSTRVNSPRNDGPELIEPIRLDSDQHEGAPAELEKLPMAAGE
jgi:putative SOS response-associated peptidase YedK